MLRLAARLLSVASLGAGIALVIALTMLMHCGDVSTHHVRPQ
jgi:hypothetical protein